MEVAIRVTAQLNPVGGTVKEARQVVESVLSSWGDDATGVEVAVLLTSEVVTNAIVHASPYVADGRVGLTVDADDQLARVEVTDGYRGLPLARDGPVGRQSGRGIWLIDLLASRWGVAPGAEGKTVWFEILSPVERSRRLRAQSAGRGTSFPVPTSNAHGRAPDNGPGASFAICCWVARSSTSCRWR